MKNLSHYLALSGTYHTATSTVTIRPTYVTYSDGRTTCTGFDVRHLATGRTRHISTAYAALIAELPRVVNTQVAA